MRVAEEYMMGLEKKSIIPLPISVYRGSKYASQYPNQNKIPYTVRYMKGLRIANLRSQNMSLTRKRR